MGWRQRGIRNKESENRKDLIKKRGAIFLDSFVQGSFTRNPTIINIPLVLDRSFYLTDRSNIESERSVGDSFKTIFIGINIPREAFKILKPNKAGHYH